MSRHLINLLQSPWMHFHQCTVMQHVPNNRLFSLVHEKVVQTYSIPDECNMSLYIEGQRLNIHDRSFNGCIENLFIHTY